ncbi:Inner membrane transport protein YdhP [Microbacterium ginsengisoli]|mgnify:FL=1|uniref:Inner membrane transport protein YdhP n=3 Tax=Microbacterium ginsengisoli TaxID=400772 RepID=A0A0F0LR67_9MICO|nr:MFS transporter [Microbacterium ginsengisoli]KJL35658.1 Inner membrane transport protein YdhP [Microbacterium ginsengisoli]
MTSPQISKGAATAALLSLAIGSFAIGMGEFVVMGLLPNVAQDLLPQTWATAPGDAIAQAGWLISLYALGVVIGAPTIAGFVARYPRHRVMLVLSIVLAVGNLLTVLAPTFGWVAVARLVTGLPHGAYFGIGALVAADVMGPGKRAKGVAFILTGLTVANVVGVPLGTFLGQQIGWRAAYGVVAVLWVVTAIMIALFVPAHPGDPGRTMRAELRVFRIPQVWFTLALGAIGFGGFFALYSYVAPMVTDVAHAPEWVVPIVLVLMGVGMTIGNIIGGYLADINLRRTLLGGLLSIALVLVILALVSHWIVPLAALVFVMGLVSSSVNPTAQTRLMDVAEDNQSIAAALNHSAFNIGNSLGAFLGGVVIAWGWGFVAPAWVGVGLALIGFGIAWLSFRVEDRSRRRAGLAIAGPAD